VRNAAHGAAMTMHRKHATVRLPPPGKRAGSGASTPVDRLLTVSEVARLLRVSRGTVYYMIRGGDLPALRIHGMLRLPRCRVLDHMRLHARRLQKPRASRGPGNSS
jgi:excisionase family DNA binding protein